MKPERLTRHFDESKQESLELYDLRDIGLELRKNEKLSKLEDIEEELGIDLATLFKALKNGAWLRTGHMGTCYIDGEPIFIEPEYLKLALYPYYDEQRKESYSYCPYETALCLYDMEYEDIADIARVKDYGRTWALTKEELL